MDTYRSTARLVGSLFIAATVAGILAVAVAPGTGDLAATASDGDRAATAALLEVVMGLAVAAIAIVIFPVLRIASERLAIAYVASRTVEAVLSTLSAIAGLAFLSVGRELVAGGASADAFTALGVTLAATRDWVNYAALPIVFTVSALVLNWGLLRAHLVPVWLSGWGLLGAVPYLAYGLLALYGQGEMMVLSAPLFFQEIVLALWLIVRGFDAAAFAPATEAARATQPVAGPQAAMSAGSAAPHA